MNELAGLMKTNGKTFKGATGRDQQGDTACVRSERVDLGMSVGSWRESTRSAGIYDNREYHDSGSYL